ncbi:MAG TPA: hypothetical protein PKM73_07385 [Verrucomicrobiota bacterium]|nr:hypothetical protein [Verrucomicrobiota bacterium]HNU51291.1 hypothetical protein [Verrucomicrobiota bacterium]
MTKKAWYLIVLAALLGGLYVYDFTDWINTPTIQIIKSDRPIRMARFRSNVLPMTFTLDGRYDVSWVKVVPADALATNKNARPCWHLVAKPKPVPLKGFFYGQTIRGMQAAQTNSRPQALEAGRTYRLIVAAGRARGMLDFRATPAEE